MILKSFVYSDLSSADLDEFAKDEVAYNLIFRISDGDQATCLRSSNNQLIYAGNTGHNAWLWVSGLVSEEEKKRVLQQLIEELGTLGTDRLTGINGTSHTAALFAELYGAKHTLTYHTHMELEAYSCPEVEKPTQVTGELQQAKREHAAIIAQFLSGFEEDAMGVIVDPTSQLPAAERFIATGNLYLWVVEGRPVSMANIAHRSPRHARINAVYTPTAERKQGYASATVAALCELVASEGLTAMLYADLKNPDSNKVYQNIGFVPSGKIRDIKFD